MKTKTHHRSIEVRHNADQSKVEQVEDLIRWFISACAVCKTEKIRHLRAGGKLHRFPKKQWTIGKPDVFSARMFKSASTLIAVYALDGRGSFRRAITITITVATRNAASAGVKKVPITRLPRVEAGRHYRPRQRLAGRSRRTWSCPEDSLRRR